MEEQLGFPWNDSTEKFSGWEPLEWEGKVYYVRHHKYLYDGKYGRREGWGDVVIMIFLTYYANIGKYQLKTHFQGHDGYDEDAGTFSTLEEAKKRGDYLLQGAIFTKYELKK